jgi:predicted nucleic acid-binding protein
MTRFVVVDTNVYIWLIRGSAEKARPYVQRLGDARIVLSFATVAELWRGAYAKDYNDASRSRLDSAIRSTVVVGPNERLTDTWAKLVNTARIAGHALGQPAQTHDAWVASTSIQYELPLLTDDGDFDGWPSLNIL